MQGHTADIKARCPAAQTDVQDHTSGMRGRRSGGAGCIVSDGVDRNVEHLTGDIVGRQHLVPGVLPQILAAQRIGIDQLHRRDTLSQQADRGCNANSPTANYQRALVHVIRRGLQPQPDRVPADGDRFCQRSFLQAEIIGHRNQIAFRHCHVLRKGAFARRHRYYLPRRTQVVPTGQTRPARATCYQRIDGHALALERPRDNDTGPFMPQDQRCRAPFVMSQIGVHVRAADADAVNPDQMRVRTRFRIRNIAILHGLRSSIDKRLHFAVKPPSTIRT